MKETRVGPKQEEKTKTTDIIHISTNILNY